MLFLVALQNYKPIINTIHNTQTPLNITVCGGWRRVDTVYGLATQRAEIIFATDCVCISSKTFISFCLPLN